LESFLNLEIKKFSPFSEPVFPPPHFGKNRNEIIEIAHFEQKWPGRFEINKTRSEAKMTNSISTVLYTHFLLSSKLLLF